MRLAAKDLYSSLGKLSETNSGIYVYSNSKPGTKQQKKKNFTVSEEVKRVISERDCRSHLHAGSLQQIPEMEL